MEKKNTTLDGALGFNAYEDALNAPGGTLPGELSGRFWPAMCFSCERKRHEALHTFAVQSTNAGVTDKASLRTCKVCVKYAMRLSEVRKQLKNLERFFQPASLSR